MLVYIIPLENEFGYVEESIQQVLKEIKHFLQTLQDHVI